MLGKRPKLGCSTMGVFQSRLSKDHEKRQAHVTDPQKTTQRPTAGFGVHRTAAEGCRFGTFCPL